MKDGKTGQIYLNRILSSPQINKTALLPLVFDKYGQPKIMFLGILI